MRFLYWYYHATSLILDTIPYTHHHTSSNIKIPISIPEFEIVIALRQAKPMQVPYATMILFDMDGRMGLFRLVM